VQTCEERLLLTILKGKAENFRKWKRRVPVRLCAQDSPPLGVNFGPWTGWLDWANFPLGDCLLWHFFKIIFLHHIFGCFFHKTVANQVILTKYGLGYILGDYFKKWSGHPAPEVTLTHPRGERSPLRQTVRVKTLNSCGQCRGE
jgi:hypothetical protein